MRVEQRELDQVVLIVISQWGIKEYSGRKIWLRGLIAETIL